METNEEFHCSYLAYFVSIVFWSASVKPRTNVLLVLVTWSLNCEHVKKLWFLLALESYGLQQSGFRTLCFLRFFSFSIWIGYSVDDFVLEALLSNCELHAYLAKMFCILTTLLLSYFPNTFKFQWNIIYWIGSAILWNQNRFKLQLSIFLINCIMDLVYQLHNWVRFWYCEFCGTHYT